MTPFPCSRGTPHCLAFLELEEEFTGQLGWGAGGGRVVDFHGKGKEV